MQPTEPHFDKSRQFYTNLFSNDSNWSTPDPNSDERARFETIEKYLSEIRSQRNSKPEDKIRILDVGCGRGWLTNLANQYGIADGVDPVPESIQTAQKMYPHLNFSVGTAADVARARGSHRYHVIISSEVIEHVDCKVKFIEEITSCLRKGGHVIITTPRGDLYKKWLKAGTPRQPVEKWITEKETVRLFECANYKPRAHDRVYQDIPGISIVHRICASRKFNLWASRLKLGVIPRNLKHRAAIYQTWCFEYIGGHSSI